MTNKLIVIVGPTGIGKTSVAIKVAKHFHTEIVSSDSRQIFKEMKIGTAVPDNSELAEVKHHFIQTHTIFEDYNASKFEHEALDKIESLFKRIEYVIMTGGSMLYIDAVCKGIDIMPDIDSDLRACLKASLEKDGIESLRIQLKQLDPEYYQKVDLKNPNRILHALEVCLMTGKTFTEFRTNPNKKRAFEIVKIGLNTDRQILHNRINKRVDLMMQKGLLNEVKKLYQDKHLTALNTVGYRELFEYFDGKISLERAVELIKRNTRRYARKQLTWFRRDESIKWFEPYQHNDLIEYIANL